jgi:predicted membrane metal-binding protein
MAYYFHRATLVSLPANALAVPLTEIIMVVAILAMIASYVSFALAKFPAMVAGVALQIMNGSVRWLGGSRIADTRVPTPQLDSGHPVGRLRASAGDSPRSPLLVAGVCWVTVLAFCAF